MFTILVLAFICVIKTITALGPNGSMVTDGPGPFGEKFDYRTEYSGNLSKIYLKYLSNQHLYEKCNEAGQLIITDSDLAMAFKQADMQLSKFKIIESNVFQGNQRAKFFNSYIHKGNVQAKHNELATKELINRKCMSEFDSVLNLKNITDSHNLDKNQDICEVDSSVSPSVKCDPKAKYRSLDGKCNNLKNTNWGSALQCQRRLLPPDYSDGVSQLRLSTNGSPLPNPRLLSKALFREKGQISNWTSFNTMWGQFIAHDSFSRIQYLGGALDCCGGNGSAIHPECLQIEDIPRDDLSIAYKQKCINLMRTVACNSCRLGPRDQINLVTSFLDLSHIYGLTQNMSKTMRTFNKGELKFDQALDGSDMPPVAKLPADQDKYDLSTCQPPPDRPQLTCFRNGDGIRGNQNPMAAALKLLWIRRHNQHSRGLATANPQWDDENLFQEARRLSIAEYNQINFGEYLPANLPMSIMDKFDLNVQTKGFTEYEPKVDPSSIQSVGGAALRFGHMTTMSVFQVPTKLKYESYGFKLRDKFFEMSDIWDGRTNDIIRGLTEEPEKEIGPTMESDLQDHLLMDRLHPRINDLGAINIQRGRDYGLPAYIYYLQYTSGAQIEDWDDLKHIIPENYVDKLKQYYGDYRDIDLYVGGLLETGVNTFMYELGLQFFHWKFGDRFYFEHSKQAGSFNIDQLNEIRSTSSLANLLCKTTDFDSIASKPFYVPSKEYNPKVFCREVKDINYKLFSE